ncbi:MAG: cell surface protein SprA [Bacteroidales bacterium]|nr:cell surface protein SprA [Bacteroidales bacterium]
METGYGQISGTRQKPEYVPLEYRFPKSDPNPYLYGTPGGGLFLAPPANVKTEIVYDPVQDRYVFKEKVGDYGNSTPYSMDKPDFLKYTMMEQKKLNWESHSKQSLKGDDGRSQGFMPQFSFGGEAFDRIFGTNTISIVPQGSAELIFGLNTTRTENPNLSESARKNTTFDFDTRLQVSVVGSIGDKMRLGINYNTDASFDFENETKLAYEGKEDDIIQKIEAGNISLPLPGSLITGSQSLFGLKTDLKFGNLSVTAVVSQQKGQTTTMEIKGGAQINDFKLAADEYEANKHFFIAGYFYENYEQSLRTMPAITSGVTVTRVEVWVTNRINATENARNLIAFRDLGENMQIPDNDSINPNSLYRNVRDVVRDFNSDINGQLAGKGLTPGVAFEKLQNARMLTSRDYTFHPNLGYISLKTALNADEVLGVAYEYTFRGKTYRVGELSRTGIAGDKGLVVKLLKGSNQIPKDLTWKLMMKNIYSITAYNLQREDFHLNILYSDDRSGNDINYIPEDEASKDILLRVMGLDRLNTQQDAFPDGVFDFVEGITINATDGKIVFPVLEPFGNTLRKFLESKNLPSSKIDKYVFDALYDSTLTKAREIAEQNKFKLQGRYRSEGGSEITLNAMNIPEGSVVVTAAGARLVENVDYTVDYSMGRVKILNTGLLESGTPIKVSTESNALFAMQQKTMLGTHLNYRFSDNFNLGATVLRLTERPLTQKVNIGDEPLANTMLGLNGNYNTELPFLTSWVDKLPLIQTKAPSSLDFSGEFAQLLPGKSKGIMNRGAAYIDDFEGSETSYDLRTFAAWHLASIPQGNGLFSESGMNNDPAIGMNRARLAWYTIDPLFVADGYMNSTTTPDYIRQNPGRYISSNFVRAVYEEDLFKNKEHLTGQPTNIAVLNVAYYPRERGPYNYDRTNVNRNGSLRDPQKRWGGMMRAVQPSDFESNNIQFIEFWMMDPFVEDPNGDLRGADLYFNLGNVSEDILKDARKSSEQGLPVDGDLSMVDRTEWGYVAKVQPIVHSFDNENRTWQDVGLDGMNDDRERNFFSDILAGMQSMLDPKPLQDLQDDPSTDNFHYPRSSEWDAMQADILTRYKYYNGQEGNSSNNDFSNSSLPNEEDINQDNTMSETESYFQYRVSVRRNDLEVGKNFIVDKVSNDTVVIGGRRVPSATWYQFRIPITEYEKSVGGIQEFKTIRFMRMFLTNCPDSIILRFARLELVRGEWRQYNQSFQPAAPGTSTPESTQATFEVASVNIEENAARTPIPYRVPPGFDRAVDQTTREMQQLNEQSMVLRAKNLVNGDARAVYRNVSYDMRRYKTLEMEVHAEAVQNHLQPDDDEMSIFVRIGSDYRNNFYEYEIPLKLTSPNMSEYTERDIWPEANHLGIDLDFLPHLKQIRNDEMRRTGSTVGLNTVFPYDAGEGRKFYVCGNPNLSNIKVVMIGLRYPQNTNYRGETRSVEVWVNELRLSNVDRKGGWAANARLAVRVADLATLAVSGETIQPGFGGIDAKINDRSTEERNQYDLSANVELGKLFPEKLNVQIPLYVGYGESFVTPEYDPTNPDVKMKDALAALPTKAARDSLKALTQDYMQRKSINLTNVRVNTVHEKPHFWDLSNLTFNYAYYETFRRSITIERGMEKNYSGGVIYDYSVSPLNIQPFKKVAFLNKPVFRIIRDFNFNPKPGRISLGTSMRRAYSEEKMRNIDNPNLRMDATVDKNWMWDRNFGLQWDLAKSLKFDFSAANMARIDEPVGVVDRHMKDEYELWKDSVWNNIRSGGRITDYNHRISASYTLPINKLPLLDWTSATASYTGEYMWGVAPIYADTSFNPGNTISNRNSITLTGQLTLSTLYNKVPYFKKITQTQRNRNQPQEAKQYKTVTFERTGLTLKGDDPRSIQHNLNTKEVEVKLMDANGKTIAADVQVVNENRVLITTATDFRGASIVVTGTVEKQGNPTALITQGFVKILLGMKNIGITYTQNGSTLLPGYGMTSNLIGMNGAAPGFPFLIGWQDRNFPEKAARNNWLVREEQLNSMIAVTATKSLSMRGVFEPFQGIRITLSALRSYTENMSMYYTWDPATNSYPESLRSPLSTGNYSITVIALGAAFEKSDKENNYHSAVFEKFKANRSIIAQRRATELRERDASYTALPDKDGGYDGYSLNAQQVMIPAFYAAYTGKDPNSTSMDEFPSFRSMLPNWDVSFDGLSNIAFLKKYFRSVGLRHSYKAVYTIGNYTSNLDYNGDIASAVSFARDLQNNFIPRNDIASANINEIFGPLIGIDLAFLNSFSTRFEMRRSRNISVGLSNLQLSENKTADFVLGLGYVFNEVAFSIRSLGGEQKRLQSDLKINADLSVRDSKTLIRRIGEPEGGTDPSNLPIQVSAGQNVTSLKISADYKINSNFTLTVFFDRIINTPFVSTSYKNYNTNFGFSMRFSLIQ